MVHEHVLQYKTLQKKSIASLLTPLLRGYGLRKDFKMQQALEEETLISRMLLSFPEEVNHVFVCFMR